MKRPISRGRVPAGFTVIEMLIVISILAVLIGLLLPTIGAIRGKAKIKAARTMLEGISASLERYHVDFDDYPFSTVGDLGQTQIEPDSLYKYLVGKDGQGILKKSSTGKVVRHIEPYFNAPPEYVRKDPSKGETGVIIVDPWGQEWVFLNCKDYTDTRRASDPSYVDDGLCRNPKTFDLYSRGPDRAKDPDPLKLVDDIANWN